MRAALARLSSAGLRVTAVSRFYASPAFPPGAGPDFVNAVAVFTGPSDPAALLETLHGVEAAFGRLRHRRWASRTLDLDLIAVGERVLPDEDVYRWWRNLPLERQAREAPETLVLPHPRMQDRSFVLIPLAEIAPDWRHPVLGLTAAALAEALPEDAKSALRPL